MRRELPGASWRRGLFDSGNQASGCVTKKPVYWHIDRFDSLEAATKCAGPDGVAAEAHGSVQTGLHLEAGESRVLPAGLVHRGRVTGTGVRSVLALILHDSAQPASHDLSDSPSLVACK
jgi:hypothetical protein